MTALLMAMLTAPFVRWQAVPFTDVTIEDTVWAPRQEVNRRVTLRHSLRMLEEHGYLRNFDLAAAGKREGFSGLIFMDSDAYKVIEAASSSLGAHPDSALEAELDAIITRIAAAQMPDGYLNTWFQVKDPAGRWKNLRDAHELYCAGHLFEAAVAHHQATGKRTLLDVARKFADHIDQQYGPGRTPGYCGHPEIELALVKLGQACNEPRYLALAREFVLRRGSHFFAQEHGVATSEYDGSYWLDDVPIAEHRKIKGHAVRAAYLMAGATDVAGLNSDEALLKMVSRVWRNTDERNTYVTGGIGPSAHNEGFTTDFDLPHATAYQETCASIALAFWNHRLALLSGQSIFADRLELSLYNAVLAGISLSGDRFFYVNPLATEGQHHRSEWFACACCPPNVSRLIASFGQYIYATGPRDLVVNLYVRGSGKATIGDAAVAWTMETGYPWAGTGEIAFRSGGAFALRLRVPGWATEAKFSVNGTEVNPKREDGYAVLERTWREGDRVQFDFPMPVRQVTSDPRVQANVGFAAVARGPVIYAWEQVDQPEALAQLWLPEGVKWRTEPGGKEIGGGIVVKADLPFASPVSESGLYRTRPTSKTATATAVPYAVWDNRQAGAMRVWLPTSPPTPRVLGLAQRAELSLSHTSGNCQPEGIRDGVEPKSSGEQPTRLCHWWPRKGGEEWVEYRWKEPVTVGSSRIYWFDDTGRGECRLPVEWRIEAWRDGAWKPVDVEGGKWPIRADTWCEVRFRPVKTDRLRLVVLQQDGWASGVHEWVVEDGD